MRRGRLLTRPPNGYTEENLGVWVNDSNDSFVIKVPNTLPVDPVEDEDWNA